jgi:SAM-dependent methyltransferase
MQDRRARLLGQIDYANSLGMEIGALHSPTVSRAEGRVIYVDYMPTEMLRAKLRHPGVSPADVVEVDVVWGDYPLREALGEPADYVVACHVIEHVPDLIGWLLQIHQALKPGGILGLAIPDRRATFDAYRPDSGIAEVIAAHLEGRRRPSLQQIIDAGVFAASSEHEPDWRLEHQSGHLPAAVLQSLPRFYDWVRTDPTLRQRYTDVHCWVFTPASFLALAEALHAIACFPYVIEALHPTDPGQIEFQVRLRAIDVNAPDIAASITRARTHLLTTDSPAPQKTSVKKNARRAQELSELHTARFWRMSAPLRALIARFRPLTASSATQYNSSRR